MEEELKEFIVHATKEINYSKVIKAKDFYEACDIADSLTEEDFEYREGNTHFKIEIEGE